MEINIEQLFLDLFLLRCTERDAFEIVAFYQVLGWNLLDFSGVLLGVKFVHPVKECVVLICLDPEELEFVFRNVEGRVFAAFRCLYLDKNRVAILVDGKDVVSKTIALFCAYMDNPVFQCRRNSSGR